MRLTRKKAIELCIELWTWLAKTGKEKEDWPGWEKYGFAENDCWFCEYVIYRRVQNKEREGWRLPCEKYCLYYKEYGSCESDINEFSNYEKWDEAKTPEERKIHANAFLEQIRAIPVKRSKK